MNATNRDPQVSSRTSFTLAKEKPGPEVAPETQDAIVSQGLLAVRASA